MIVFLAGMQRSGSTFSFNVVRELLSRRGTVYHEACPVASTTFTVEHSGNADFVLFKAHKADDMTLRFAELNAIKVICTLRKPEDAIASWMETFGFDLETSIVDMRRWINMFERLREHSLLVRYEDIDRQPWLAALRMARYICPNAGLVEIFHVAKKYSKKNVKRFTDNLNENSDNIQRITSSLYDIKTLFHPRHVSALKSRPARERIGAEAVSKIRYAFKSEIDGNGELI